MKYTISAVFENIDMAEMAARTVKKRYPEISKINIKYKTNNIADTDTTVPVTAGLAANNIVGSTVGFYPLALNAMSNGDNDNKPEYLKSTQSKVVINARKEDEKGICACLRSLGGLNVNSLYFAFKS